MNEWLDFFVKAGVPAGLGVFVVTHLLRSVIPEQQKVFKEALESEQRTHAMLMNQLTTTLQNEGQQTRAAIDRLNGTSMKLTEVVYKMSGVVSTLPTPTDGDGASRRVV
jgi:predicted nuclease with TOPRIM domain